MKTGDVCIIEGLEHRQDANGHYCELLTDLIENAVPEHDGVERTKLRHGFRIIGTDTTGYMPPQFLRLYMDAEDPQYAVKWRALCIHLTGMEDA